MSKTLVETLNGWEIYDLHPGLRWMYRYEVYSPVTKQSFQYFNLSMAQSHAETIPSGENVVEE